MYNNIGMQHTVRIDDAPFVGIHTQQCSSTYTVVVVVVPGCYNIDSIIVGLYYHHGIVSVCICCSMYVCMYEFVCTLTVVCDIRWVLRVCVCVWIAPPSTTIILYTDCCCIVVILCFHFFHHPLYCLDISSTPAMS